MTNSSMTTRTRYVSPLGERYASAAMLELWSPQMRYGLWRRLWVTLAEKERELAQNIGQGVFQAAFDSLKQKLR